MYRPSDFTKAKKEWISQAYEVVRERAQSRESFTVDDLWPHLTSPPEPRWLGNVLIMAKHNRLITPDGYAVSYRRHEAPIRKWVSLIFRGVPA